MKYKVSCSKIALFNPPVTLKFTHIFYPWGQIDIQQLKPPENY